MTLWLDAQLPPTLAAWFTENLGVTAFSIKYLGLDRSSDLRFSTERRPQA